MCKSRTDNSTIAVAEDNWPKACGAWKVDSEHNPEERE